MKVWVDGQRRRTLDVQDRGLQYGDGLFETMCVRDGGVRLLELHLERLSEGLARLRIRTSARIVRAEICAATARVRRATLKLIVTRGSGERGYRPRGNERARRILLLAAPSPPAAQPAVRLRVCRTHLASGSPLAGLKTLGRLESVLARAEWRGARVFEGLMCDSEGHIVCGTMTNLFLRRGRTLYTPLLDRCGVAGIMRRWILNEAPALGCRVKEARIAWRDLAAAEEVFVSNAVIGVRPVRAIEWRQVQGTLEFRDFELAGCLARRLEAL